MASATSSSNSVTSSAVRGFSASSSLRCTSASNSRSDIDCRPAIVTVAQPTNSTNATMATISVSNPPAPDSDGGFSSISSRPTVNAASAALIGPRNMSTPRE